MDTTLLGGVDRTVSDHRAVSNRREICETLRDCTAFFQQFPKGKAVTVPQGQATKFIERENVTDHLGPEAPGGIGFLTRNSAVDMKDL